MSYKAGTPDPIIFDVAKTPMERGVNFIEASAGTGKTYAIGMLVLRAICEQDIGIDRILIVTFTRAAAEELRSRVRARLVEARDLLQGRHEDASLRAWQEHAVKDEGVARRFISRLQLAIVNIDRAGIFTIHSFCQRMLSEQALESGQLFRMDLLTSLDDLRLRAAEDFWRIHVYSLSPWSCSLVMGQWSSPADLLANAFVHLHGDTRIEPEVEDISLLWQNLEGAIARMKEWWLGSGTALQEALAEACGEDKFKKAFVADFAGSFRACEKFFLGQAEKFPANLSWLTVAGLKVEINGNKFRGKKKDEIDPFLNSMGLPEMAATELLELKKQLFIGYRIFFAGELERGVGRQLQEHGSISFDQLISRLAAGLCGEETHLQTALQARYDLALIDEFQDTDNEQWHIFSKLFASKKHSLYLIGDPKQAIYKFRGADIYSYFTARTKTDYFYSLDTNYRSHRDLVRGVNGLFAGSDDPFLFKEEGLLYYPVKSGKSRDVYLVDAEKKPLVPFVYLQLEENDDDKKGKWSSALARTAIRGDIVAETLHLLSISEPTSIHKLNRDGQSIYQPLRPQDIAVLVRSNSQAEAYQQAFLQVGVPAIIAGRKTIFETDESHELLLLLQAIIDHDDLRLLKTAMTISLFACTGDDIMAIWQDEQAVAEWYNVFLQCYHLWSERGVLTMLYFLVDSKELFANLVQFSQPERRIANFTHLFEVLQQAETAANLGPRQSLLWLRSALTGKQKNDAFELRLESDEEALQIVTMHSSKGLQYPVVFCPDLYGRSARIKNEKNVISCHDGGAVIDFGSEHFSERRERACREELAEDLRLAYVALTRAELRSYTYWADISARGAGVDASLNSALGHLLFAGDDIDYEEQQERLKVLARESGALFQHVSAEPATCSSYGAERRVKSLATRPHRPRLLATDWQMTSYSALASLGDHAPVVQFDRDALADAPRIAFAELPKGARFGNAVHDLLEKCAFADLVLHADDLHVQGMMEQKCEEYGLQLDQELFTQLFVQACSTPLFAGGFSLADLSRSRCLKEMEFYLRLAHINLAEINTILADEPTVQAISAKKMRGYMTGFIDLVCQHEGKYYVVDYKSNYLGELQSDYSGDSLVQVMAAHNYGLQYYIYSLVLHQHLQTFVEGYSYEEHFGGVMYLFVRGMDPDIAGSGVFATRPARGLIEALDRLIGGGEE
ncbi:exodeoxyribonuclease V subunit beta [Desulfotalea psychrophila]|uniref:DNA 3'-5' helicase n=1 Tax=Desulfotalea psychrophila (strain LSv54 / DSM 12343) TaxID=177439 RepID=Q6ANK1_DESPS|nr:exodeoxyribonuclease V subunit beta [Desulfotalea psychrophila]CAG36073.1 related to exodeoxyribonuclease V, beta chain [Desulfotalea psychrophila LSv54]